MKHLLLALLLCSCAETSVEPQNRPVATLYPEGIEVSLEEDIRSQVGVKMAESGIAFKWVDSGENPVTLYPSRRLVSPNSGELVGGWAQNGRAEVSMWNLDLNQRDYAIAWTANAISHELGHLWGLGHVSGCYNIMSNDLCNFDFRNRWFTDEQVIRMGFFLEQTEP